MKKKYIKQLIFTAVLIALAVSVPGCSETEKAASTDIETAPAAPVVLINSNSPIIKADEKSKAVTFLAEVNGTYFHAATQYCAVFKDASNGNKSIFRSLADHISFYKALKKIGAQAGAKGDLLDVTVTWNGAGKEYTLDEVIKNKSGKSIAMRFSGNPEKAKKKKNACLLSLNNSPVSVAANESLGALKKGKKSSFRGNRDILPPDMTVVAITVKVKKS
ncbi:MAG: hypothetical protein GY754_25395 [bacterium]|nr:hypothetical protein [bacterium]